MNGPTYQQFVLALLHNVKIWEAAGRRLAREGISDVDEAGVFLAEYFLDQVKAGRLRSSDFVLRFIDDLNNGEFRQMLYDLIVPPEGVL